MAQLPTITASTTDFLALTPTSAENGGTAVDTFVLKIDGFSENGVPIQIPGLNTSYGLYIALALSGRCTRCGASTRRCAADCSTRRLTARDRAPWRARTSQGQWQRQGYRVRR